MTDAARRNLDLPSAVREAELAYAAANPNSRKHYERACRAMPGGNLRSHLYFSPFPLTLARGEGAYVWDLDGHCYADFLGEYAAGLFGHSDPTIAAALKSAIDNGMVMGGPGTREAMLAEVLCERFPSLDVVRFTNSGTEANLFALGAARIFTGRDAILTFSGAYHGSCFRFAGGGSPLNVPFPFVLARYNDTDGAVTTIEKHADRLAAVIVEPVLGAGGYIAGERDFLLALREATAKHGIVLIFDEVVTARMSPGGVQELLGITPDMTTLGKHTGGGCSFGAFGGRADIMRRFDPREPDAVYHAGTFNNNQLSMTAGHVAMSEVFRPEAVASLRQRGEQLRARLQEMIRGRQLPMYVTGFGSTMNFHYTGRPVRCYEDVPVGTDLQKKLQHFALLARNQYCPPRGGLLLSLATSETEINRFASEFEAFIDEHGLLIQAAAANDRLNT